MTDFTGLTWDHPRGYDALAEAANRINFTRRDEGLSDLISWDKQPLEGFESAPIADLAAKYDLLVLDHPHIGEAVAEKCLMPLNEIFSAEEIESWQSQSIGPSMRSYNWGEKQWALPLDVAAQVTAYRPDIIKKVPDDWFEICDLAKSKPIAQSLAGPHAFLTLISIAGSYGHSPQGEQLLPDDDLKHGLEIMHRLYERRPEGTEALNPIALLERMAHSGKIAMIPLVFNYVTYSHPGYASHLVQFANSPVTSDGLGGVLGGTGIAISRKCKPTPDLCDHIRWLMSVEAQVDLFPVFGGQPSARAAWENERVNADVHDFYQATERNIENALIRPRFDGYIAAQNKMSACIRDALENKNTISGTIQTLRAIWQSARRSARGGLDDDRGNQTMHNPTPKALEGYTILDFSHLLQGPFATQLLADIGADVIKVERPGTGELSRSLTFRNKWVGGVESPNYLAWNRNKRSLALNLKDPDARKALMELAQKADVVIQNFRPGVMERLGYGYEDFKAVNPRIIYCSGSGYGEDGPYLDRPGQDMLVQGLTGIMAATGQADQPPTPVGVGFSDQIGAMNMVYAILAALLWREKSGKGQKVEINLMAGMLAHQNQEMVMAMNFNEDFHRPNSGIGHPGMDAPFGTYPVTDGWVTIAMSPYKTLVSVLGNDDLLVYDDPETLFAKRDEVWEKLAEETRKWSMKDLMAALLKADIWCGEVKTHLEAAKDPQVEHMGLIQTYEHPNAGEVKVVGPAIRMSETPPSIDRHAPLVGEHTKEVLSDLGWSDEAINDLIDKGAAGIPD